MCGRHLLAASCWPPNFFSLAVVAVAVAVVVVVVVGIRLVTVGVVVDAVAIVVVGRCARQGECAAPSVYLYITTVTIHLEDTNCWKALRDRQERSLDRLQTHVMFRGGHAFGGGKRAICFDKSLAYVLSPNPPTRLSRDVSFEGPCVSCFIVYASVLCIVTATVLRIARQGLARNVQQIVASEQISFSTCEEDAWS